MSCKISPLFFPLILLFQCNQEVRIAKCDPNFKIQQSIAVNDRGVDLDFDLQQRQGLKQLGLLNLKDGFGNLALRFWIPATPWKSTVLTFLFTNQGVFVNRTKFRYERNDKNEIEFVLVESFQRPLTNDQTLETLGKFLELRFFDLPDYTNISGYNDLVADGDFYTFEFATCKSFRHFHGFALKYNKQFSEVRKEMEFINYLELKYLVDN
jgi:hypothetical protein